MPSIHLPFYTGETTRIMQPSPISGDNMMGPPAPFSGGQWGFGGGPQWTPQMGPQWGGPQQWNPRMGPQWGGPQWGGPQWGGPQFAAGGALWNQVLMPLLNQFLAYITGQGNSAGTANSTNPTNSTNPPASQVKTSSYPFVKTADFAVILNPLKWHPALSGFLLGSLLGSLWMVGKQKDKAFLEALKSPDTLYGALLGGIGGGALGLTVDQLNRLHTEL